MKHIITFLLIIISTLHIKTVSAQNDVVTSIKNCDDLQDMQNNLSGKYELAQDINCENMPFISIGNFKTPFAGELDGKNHKISNLKFAFNSKSGLFGHTINKAKIQNLAMENVINNFPDSENASGILVGYAYDYTFISNVTIQNSNNIGGRFHIGGLVGILGDHAQIVNSSVLNTIISCEHICGGLVGTSSGTIINSYSNAAVRGNLSYSSIIGGLVGSFSGSIVNSYALNNYSGGLNGSDLVGGLVGYAGYGNITNSYAHGLTNIANQYGGGLIGEAFDASIRNCYATTKISASKSSQNIGGLIGKASLANVINSYWDIETTGQSISAGGVGKSTAEMFLQSTYEDWDFNNVWEISEGKYYPTLK